MKLVASMVVRNELGRYLPLVVESLLDFCDEVRIFDDCSDDGTFGWASGPRTSGRVFAATTEEPSFFAHEGRVRQTALEWALAGAPTHVLAIDADEFVADGALVRAEVERSQAPAFSLCMSEVWKVDAKGLMIRQDGRWGPHRAPILWRVPARLDASWRIPDAGGASGRIPRAVVSLARRALSLDVDIYHFGWVDESERVARHARYADRAGFGHNPAHIRSILFPDSMVRLERNEWPSGLNVEIVEKLIARAAGREPERRYTLDEVRALGWTEPKPGLDVSARLV